jgi:hypothetical protein
MTTPKYVLALPIAASIAASLLIFPGAAQAQCGGYGPQGSWCGQSQSPGFRAYRFRSGDYGWRERGERRERRDYYEDRRERRDRYEDRRERRDRY